MPAILLPFASLPSRNRTQIGSPARRVDGCERRNGASDEGDDVMIEAVVTY